jgi:hypothetical protein
MKLGCEEFERARLPLLATVAVLLPLCFSAHTLAQQPGQKTFSSTAEACDALFAAAQSNDANTLGEIFGADGKQIVSSGDDAEDAENRATFVRRYQEMHRLMKEPDGTTILYIGAENWPTPIPLVSRGNSWYFDTNAGKQEILYRRIGRNEVSTIGISQELVAAQKEYSSSQHNEYARKIKSDEGQHDGLYWSAAEGQPKSPIGPLLASAFVDSSNPEGAPTPYRGYYYRLLGHSGSNNRAAGFAFVAYPAEYRSSGVMTFVVAEDGTVYQKDLGDQTEALAKAIKGYNTDSSWQKVEERQEETAGNH